MVINGDFVCFTCVLCLVRSSTRLFKGERSLGFEKCNPQTYSRKTRAFFHPFFSTFFSHIIKHSQHFYPIQKREIQTNTLSFTLFFSNRRHDPAAGGRKIAKEKNYEYVQVKSGASKPETFPASMATDSSLNIFFFFNDGGKSMKK